GDLARYGMLESIREYVTERLVASGEARWARAAHLAHYLDLARRAEERFRGPDEEAWLELLAAEHENLRAALAFSLREPVDGALLRLVAALWWFWYLRGHFTEGREW